jgi:hypothetical protein
MRAGSWPLDFRIIVNRDRTDENGPRDLRERD